MTKPWKEETAPAPVLLSPWRVCKVCHERQSYPAAFGLYRRICHACRAAKDTDAQRLRMKAWREQRKAEQRENVRGKRLMADRFALSVQTLEALWGPYRTWTREQHAQHSVMLRQLAGVPEDPQPREQAA